MKAVRLNQAIMLLSCAGIFVAGLLTLTHYAGKDLPCTIQVACAEVTNSDWSKIGPIPVALIGLLGYLAILGVSLARLSVGYQQAPGLNKLGFGMTAVGAVTSLVLTVYSVTEIGYTCQWCIASAIIMFVLFVLHYLLMTSEMPEQRGFAMQDIGVLGISSVTALIAMVIVFTVSQPKSLMQTVDDSKKALILGDQKNATGNLNGDIILVEFADLSCHTCRDHYPENKEMLKEFPRMKLVFRHYPLFEMEGHEMALPGALVAEYAASQGKFWEFMDNIMIPEQKLVAREQITTAAKLVGLNDKETLKAMNGENKAILDAVQKDRTASDELGLNQTPTYFLIVPGQKILAMGPSAFKDTINSAKWRAILSSK